MAIEWYYATNGKKQGPVQSAELKRLAISNTLKPNDFVWKQGLDNWVKASSIKGLFPIRTSSAEPPDLPKIQPREFQDDTIPEASYSPPSQQVSQITINDNRRSNAELLLLVESKKKSGALAAALNLFLPGAGYIYCGRWFLGIIALFFVIGMFVVTGGLAAVGIVFILVLDGFLCAGKYNKKIVEDIIKKENLLRMDPDKKNDIRQIFNKIREERNDLSVDGILIKIEEEYKYPEDEIRKALNIK